MMAKLGEPAIAVSLVPLCQSFPEREVQRSGRVFCAACSPDHLDGAAQSE